MSGWTENGVVLTHWTCIDVTNSAFIPFHFNDDDDDNVDYGAIDYQQRTSSVH